MTHPQKKKTESLKEKIQAVFSPEGYSDRLTLPPGFGGVSQIVLTMGKTVCLDGCQGLICYRPDYVTLSLCDGIVTVYGKNLMLKTFSERQLAIIGDILGVYKGMYREELALEDC